LEYARRIEQAGADGLELNLYELATDFDESGAQVERRALAGVKAGRGSGRIPPAVQRSPFCTCFTSLRRGVGGIGMATLVLFNRFYQPEIDPEQLQVVRALRLSDSSELLLRLRWLAILSGRVRASLVATGGVHTALDAVKAVMAGAHAVQMVSALLE